MKTHALAHSAHATTDATSVPAAASGLPERETAADEPIAAPSESQADTESDDEQAAPASSQAPAPATDNMPKYVVDDAKDADARAPDLSRQSSDQQRQLGELILSKLDALESQMRVQAAEQHFELRRVERALGEKLAQASNGESRATATQAPATRASHAYGETLNTLPRMPSSSRMRRTPGAGRCSSYVDQIIDCQRIRDSRRSRTSRSSEGDSGRDSGIVDSPVRLRPPPSADSSSPRSTGWTSPLANNKSPPQAAGPSRTSSATAARHSPTPNGGAAPPTRSILRTSRSKSKLMAELAPKEPRRGSFLAIGTLRRHSCEPRFLTEDHAPAATAAMAAEARLSKQPRLVSEVSFGGTTTTALEAAAADDDDEDESALTREERLRLMINEDQNVETMLTRIRRTEIHAEHSVERERRWQSRHPVSSRLVLSPGSPLKSWWEALMLLLVLLSAVSMPLDLAFDLGRRQDEVTGVYSRDEGVLVLFLLLDAAFVVDFVLTFRIAYDWEAAQLLIRQPSAIFKHWFAGWFIFDLVAAIPLATLSIIPYEAGFEWVTGLKLIRIIRLLKLPRLLEANPVFRRLRVHLSHSYIELVFGLCVLLYVCHFFGCLYVLISKQELERVLEAVLDQARSSGSDDGLAGAEGAVAAAADAAVASRVSEGWLPPVSCHSVAIDGDGVLRLAVRGREMYLYSLVWTINAVSGTSIPYPNSMTEMGFTASMVFLGYLVTAYVIGIFTTAIAQLSAAKNQGRQKRDYIDQFLKARTIPRPLRRQVAQFYEFAGFDESEETLSELPISLRLQLDLHLNRDLFLKVPFFKNCDTSFLIVMVPRVHREYIWSGKTVLREGQFATGLHMLARGFCRVSVEGAVTNVLTRNDFFGEESLLQMDSPSQSTIVTISQVDFMVLGTENFEELLELYPQMRRALTKYEMIKEKSRQATSGTKLVGDGEQLDRVRLEFERTKHMMPQEQLSNLLGEIDEFERAIKAAQARTREKEKRHLSATPLSISNAASFVQSVLPSVLRRTPIQEEAHSSRDEESERRERGGGGIATIPESPNRSRANTVDDAVDAPSAARASLHDEAADHALPMADETPRDSFAAPAGGAARGSRYSSRI